MAKDDLLDEPLFREIDEDLRHEQWMRRWQRYRGLLFAAIAAILLAVAGSQIWLHYQREAVNKSSVQFADAQALVDSDKAAALTAFQALAADGSAGYALLARLQAAALLEQQGDRTAAIAAYRQLEQDAPEPVYRDLASLLAILVELKSPVEDAERNEIGSKLVKLAADTSPWRFLARELQAQLAFTAGNRQEAERIANQLIGDPTTPAGIRNRARMLLTQTGQS